MKIGRGWLCGVTVLIALLLSTSARAQAVDEVWKMRDSVTVDGLLSDWSPAAGTCGNSAADKKLGGLAELIIYKSVVPQPGTPGEPFYVIVLQANNLDDSETGYAKINRLYCIKPSALTDNFVPKDPALTGGVLSVPFKLHFAPTKMMAGGALGGYLGHSFRHSKDYASVLLLFASLTNVPLNDMNEKVPQTQWGLGLGAGWVLTIPNNFQAGIVVGWDLFSWPDDWPYKATPWLSISIGYSFIGPQTQNSAKAATMAVQ